jgi:hypothetical protein
VRSLAPSPRMPTKGPPLPEPFVGPSAGLVLKPAALRSAWPFCCYRLTGPLLRWSPPRELDYVIARVGQAPGAGAKLPTNAKARCSPSLLSAPL